MLVGPFWTERSQGAVRNQPGVYSGVVTPGRRLRVVEAFRSIFYASLPVAIHGGHFAAEGLEIELATAESGAGTVDAPRNGYAGIALSGRMRSSEPLAPGASSLADFP